MKKRLFLISIAVLFLCTACSEGDASTGKNKETDIEAYTDEELVETGSNVAEDITELECYVENFECGYYFHADKVGIFEEKLLNVRWVLIMCK